jgi:H2-forming N5,N10-methylenetetrahydromethanopterin dehydrogenase-like enzyme
VYKDDHTHEEKIGKDEVIKRTNDLLENFKENYIKNNNNDFINDAITNMVVCCRVYEKIFEGFIIMSQINKLPQELIEGFVKWSTGQIEDLKEKIQEIDKKRDMR